MAASDVRNKRGLELFFKPFLMNDLEEVKGWFASPQFIFDSPKPHLCRWQDVELFLSFRTSHLSLVCENTEGKAVNRGLVDIEIPGASGKVNLELQFALPSDWNRIGPTVLEKISNFVFTNFDAFLISKYIFGFDEGALAVFKNSKYGCDGKFSSLVFRDGRYWDVYVYTLSKEDLRGKGGSNDTTQAKRRRH